MEPNLNQSINTKLLELTEKYLQNVLITEDFCKYRDDLVLKFPDHGRSIKDRTMDADCLLAEYTLINEGAVTPPYNMSHDFILYSRRIDVKVIRDKYFSVGEYSKDWFSKGISEGSLTDFAFFNFAKTRNDVLKPGDVVTLQFIKALPAHKVLYNLRRSMYNKGYYYSVR